MHISRLTAFQNKFMGDGGWVAVFTKGAIGKVKWHNWSNIIDSIWGFANDKLTPSTKTKVSGSTYNSCKCVADSTYHPEANDFKYFVLLSNSPSRTTVVTVLWRPGYSISSNLRSGVVGSIMFGSLLTKSDHSKSCGSCVLVVSSLPAAVTRHCPSRLMISAYFENAFWISPTTILSSSRPLASRLRYD